MRPLRAIAALSDIRDLDDVLARSLSRPVLIFKHSAQCGRSAQAYDEILALFCDPDFTADVYVVDVWAARLVSDAIAARFTVRHESPQVLVIMNNRVLWSASHFRVTAEAIRAALASLAATIEIA